MYTPNQNLLHCIDESLDEVFKLSDWITDHPEISGEEKESSTAVIDFLKNHDYEIASPYGGIDYSFRAVPKGADSSKPRIAILCEYDALPDVGHACGHSLSCGVSLLTALALRKTFPNAPYVFELIGTPAEETIGGKAIMTENGAFDGYKLAIMSHVDNYHSPQARILACNDMYITFHGKPAHASGEPYEGINALNAANLFFVAADMMRQHIPRYAQYHGIITHGGSAPNIVPDRTEIDLYVRSATLKGLAELRERLTNCVKGAAIATGCSYEIEQRSDTYTDMFYPKSSERDIIEIYDAFGYDYHIYTEPEGSTDMGNVDLIVPAIHLYCRGTDEFTPLHTPEIVQLIKGERGKRTLLEGTRVLASFLNEISEHPEKLDEIIEEHRIYRSVDGASN